MLDQESERILLLIGHWDIEAIATFAAQKTTNRSQADNHGPFSSLRIDGSKLDYLDTAGAMYVLRHIVAPWGISDAQIHFQNCSEESRAIFTLVSQTLAPSVTIRKKSTLDFLTRLGRSGTELLHTVDEIFCFIGQIAIAAARVLKTPSVFRVREVCNQIQSTGLEAVGIVCLVTFLIGIVIAYLTGVQMEQYGANIFIVDGIGLGMCRELAPILVAIVVAGRSGSAFTAQLGTMKLNQEIDAAESLGLSAIQVLVLPRVLALMLVMPLLVFLGDVAGILGGLVAADLRLGVSANTFLDRLQVILPLQTIFVGLSKAPVFAFFIAAIACHLGLTTEPNAQSVGEHTTKTVVRAIVAVILLNATFAVLFSELGI